MTLYKRKPIVLDCVDAMQLGPGTTMEIVTSEGVSIKGKPGQWFVQDADGGQRFWEDEEFRANYAKVPEVSAKRVVGREA